MPNSFGSVDYSRIAGMRKLFETAIKSQEDIAVQQMQVEQEVNHRKRVAVAMEIWRQAGEIAPKNPLVANNMLRSGAAGMLSSNDERDQKFGQQMLQNKYELTSTVQTSEIKTEGFTPSVAVTERYGTEGDVKGFSIIRGQKLPDPLEHDTKLLRMREIALRMQKLNKDMSGISLKDVADYEEKYLKGYYGRQEILSRYPEAEIKGWAEKLSKKAPDVLNRLQQTGDNEIAQLVALYKSDEKTKDLLSDLDTQQLMALRQYMLSSRDVNAYQDLLAKHKLQFDPDTRSFIEIGAKPAVKSASGKISLQFLSK